MPEEQLYYFKYLDKDGNEVDSKFYKTWGAANRAAGDNREAGIWTYTHEISQSRADGDAKLKALRRSLGKYKENPSYPKVIILGILALAGITWLTRR